MSDLTPEDQEALADAVEADVLAQRDEWESLFAETIRIRDEAVAAAEARGREIAAELRNQNRKVREQRNAWQVRAETAEAAEAALVERVDAALAVHEERASEREISDRNAYLRRTVWTRAREVVRAALRADREDGA